MISASTQFLIKENELYSYYKYDLSEAKIMMIRGKSRISLFCALIFIIFVLIGATGPLYGISSLLSSIFIIIGVPFSIFFVRLSDYFSINLILHTYPQYSALLNKAIFKQTNKRTFLRAFRSDKINEKLNDPSFRNFNLDELILYYKNSSDSILKRRCGPITLATIISFPIWSEFVGVMISDGTRLEEKIAMSIALLLISFAITFLISSIKTMLETILLAFPTDLNELSEIIKLTKMSRLEEVREYN